jgi:hypothetical protein
MVVLAAGLYGVVSAQEVFTNGIDVNGQMVQGIGLLDLSSTNSLARVPSAGQLMGVHPTTGALLNNSAHLLPLRPLAVETDHVAARTTNGLTFYDENSNAVLVIRSGVVWGAGGVLSNFTVCTSAITGGTLPASILP